MADHFEKIGTKLPPEETEKIIKEFREKGFRIEENEEYFIIPKKDKNGKEKRMFVPKRFYIDLAIKNEKGTEERTQPSIKDVLEAIINYPDEKLSNALNKLKTSPDKESDSKKQ